MITVLCLLAQTGLASQVKVQQMTRGIMPFASLHLADDGTSPPLADGVDWSRAVVDSTMKRYPNPSDLGSWGYAKALFLFGEYLVWKRAGDPRYLQYIKGWVDTHVDGQGNLDHNTESLDSMMPGNLLLLLYQETKEEKYKLAADKIRQRLNTYPRTSDGGFWHATGASRQHQLWGDGVFMSLPFLVRYGRLFGESAYANAEAAKQLIVYAGHLRSSDGLLYHAYDESGTASWADPSTHHSAEFWCRAMGWFGMTLVDVLDVLPASDPKRPQLIAILRDLVRGLAKYQDSRTGLWYQVVDKGSTPGNWLETSSSSMYSYVISVAVQRGYVDKSYEPAARSGYKGVLGKLSIDSNGLANISDICEGTNVADLAYYLARKRNVNDLHGLGAFLIMNEHFLTSASAMELTRPPIESAQAFTWLVKQENLRLSQTASITILDASRANLPLILEGGRPPLYSTKYGGIDAFNALMTKQKADLPLSDVLKQLDEIHRRLLDYIRRAREEQFTVETRFRRRLRLDTYSHYPKYAKTIRKWRQRRFAE